MNCNIYCFLNIRRRTNRSTERLPLLDYLRQKVPTPKPVDSRTIQEKSVMAIQYYVRSTRYVLQDQLLSIGSRHFKHFFLLNYSGKQVMMNSTFRDPKSKVGIATVKIFSNILKRIDHPNINKVYEADFLPDSNLAVVVRKYYKTGSLRDYIYKTKPVFSFGVKYNKKIGKPLKSDVIALYGKQILNGLRYLELQGIPYTHLHSGNIFITNNVCQLSEIENAFLKLERFYEYIFKDYSHEKSEIFILADLNVIAFGCVLFEMAMGYPPTNIREIRTLPNKVDAVIRDILLKIFNPERLVPSISDLLLEPFFAYAESSLYNHDKISWSVQEKEFIKNAYKYNTKIIWPTDESMLMQSISYKGVSPGQNKQKRRSTIKTSKSKRKTLNTLEVSGSNYSSLSYSSPVSSPSTVGPITPGPPPPPPPPGPPLSGPPPPPPPSGPPPPKSSAPPPSSSKSALFSSITSFNTSKLKKTVTIDKSKPIF